MFFSDKFHWPISQILLQCFVSMIMALEFCSKGLLELYLTPLRMLIMPTNVFDIPQIPVILRSASFPLSDSKLVCYFWLLCFSQLLPVRAHVCESSSCRLQEGNLRVLSPIVCLHLPLADHQKKFGEDYGSCQAGISNFLTEVGTAAATSLRRCPSVWPISMPVCTFFFITIRTQV